MYSGESILKKEIKRIKEVKNIEIFYGKHEGLWGNKPVSSSNKSITIASYEEYKEKEDYTSYDGFIVFNDTSLKNNKLFQKINCLINRQELEIF